MTVKLRILHGKLQSKRGGSAGSDVEIHGSRFVIGSEEDCSMRCPSSAVSPHHCELRVESQGVVIRDLGSETGVWVNDEPVHDQRTLEAGDHLKIGRLEFEVLIDGPLPAELTPEADTASDSVADDISDSLINADELERAHRLQDPELRHFHLEEAAEEARKKKEASAEPELAEPEEGKKKGKKKMGKFTPPPPPPQPDNTEDAAQEALKRLFGS